MENTRKFDLDLGTFAWGAFFILWGITEMFPSLPEGVSVKKIVCTLTDIVGKPQRVPFKFNDLPLP